MSDSLTWVNLIKYRSRLTPSPTRPCSEVSLVVTIYLLRSKYHYRPDILCHGRSNLTLFPHPISHNGRSELDCRPMENTGGYHPKISLTCLLPPSSFSLLSLSYPHRSVIAVVLTQD